MQKTLLGQRYEIPENPFVELYVSRDKPMLLLPVKGESCIELSLYVLLKVSHANIPKGRGEWHVRFGCRPRQASSAKVPSLPRARSLLLLDRAIRLVQPVLFQCYEADNFSRPSLGEVLKKALEKTGWTIP